MRETQTFIDAPKTRLSIVAAHEQGFMVVDYPEAQFVSAWNIEITSKPLAPVVVQHGVLFAGTLDECAAYIVREMTPAGQPVASEAAS